MEVRFLGVGAALPAPGQTNCAYVVHLPSVTLLFDCGPAVLQQLAAVNLTPGNITHLFVSHRHGDHALGFPMFVLWRVLDSAKGVLPAVITSTATAPALRQLWSLAYPDGPTPDISFIELPHDVPGSYQLAPGILLRTWPMVHSVPAPVLGLRVETEGKILAFTADAAVDEAVIALAQDADLLIADARYATTVQPIRTTTSRFHCSALEAGQLAQRAGVRRLGLVHIGAEYAGRHEALVKEAGTVFGGEVFAPRAGDLVRV